MSNRSRLLLIAASVLAIASATSHFLARTLHLYVHVGQPLKFGEAPAKAVVAGSSLTYYGVAWADVAAALHVEFTGFGVPGGSVREMEVLQRSAPEARYTFLGISEYDINEYHISELRSQIVPFTEEVSRLWSCHAEWPHVKKVLSQYPLKYVRMAFPTAGASETVMVGIRQRFQNLLHKSAPEAPREGAVISDKGNSNVEDITSWTPAHLTRVLTDIRTHGGVKFEFHSTKREALFHFLDDAEKKGRVIVLILPESPAYRTEFLTGDVKERFEALVSEAKEHSPSTVWIRLDLEPELESNKYYWDPIHLNANGQAIATRIILSRLAAEHLP